MELHDLTALDLAAALRAGEASAADVTEHALDRAHRFSASVGAFVHISADRARADAERADATLTRARREGGLDELAATQPLLGVPVPIKDLNQVAGLPFEAGSAVYRGNVADRDDGVVTLLAGAGTVMLGKTTTPEFGMPAYTEPDVAPPARTPWDLSRSAGGSSGGAAAAVASRIVPAAHASDGGGSIRIPAAATGLVGLKPSRGLVSPGPHGTDGFGLATSGALTRDVRDTAALLDVLSAPWPGDAPGPARPDGGHLAALDGDGGGAAAAPLRIGVLRETVVVDGGDVHPAALAGVDRAVALLEALGHEVTPAPRPFGQADWEVFMPIWSLGALSVPVPEQREGDLVPLTRWLREVGRDVSGLELALAHGGMQVLQRQVAMRWQDFDAVVSPMLAGPPAPIGALRDDADPAGDFFAQRAYTPWGSLWNITGAPAISLPLHRAEVDGVTLPFGVMIGMPHGHDAHLLRLAAQLEEADPWPLPPEPRR